MSRLNHRPSLFDCSIEHQLEIETLAFKFNQAARDTRDVEQIIDQICHMLDLASDYISCMPNTLLVDAYHFQHLRGSADRRKRIAQLMRQHRKKLIFAPAFLPEQLFSDFLV